MRPHPSLRLSLPKGLAFFYRINLLSNAITLSKVFLYLLSSFLKPRSLRSRALPLPLHSS